MIIIDGEYTMETDEDELGEMRDDWLADVTYCGGTISWEKYLHNFIVKHGIQETLYRKTVGVSTVYKPVKET